MMNIMDEERRKQFEAQLNAPPPPALERLRAFLAGYVASGDRDLLKLATTKRPGSIIGGVEAIDEVLASSAETGVLYHLVTYDGNQRLPEQTDKAAAEWLKQLATDLREWLGEYAPAPPEG